MLTLVYLFAYNLSLNYVAPAVFAILYTKKSRLIAKTTLNLIYRRMIISVYPKL